MAGLTMDLTLATTALATTALATTALEAPPTHVVHPFGYFQAEWNSNVTGRDPGDTPLRLVAGATYRYNHPGGTSLTAQYRANYLTFPRLSALSNVAHLGTLMVSHRVPVSQVADFFTPYLGIQVLHHMPTATLGGPGRTDGDYFLGFSFLKRWQPAHLIFYGAHLDYFGAGVPAAAFWGTSLNLGYRWTPSARLQFTASNRVQWRHPIDAQPSTVRESLLLDLDIFPVGWLQVGPRLGVHYDTGNSAWSWTAGVAIGSNVWWTAR